MSNLAWLTVDSLPSAMITLAFTVPQDDTWLAQLRGALTPLIYPENFEQFGTLTPIEQSDIWRDIILAFFEEKPMFPSGLIVPYGGNSPYPDGWLYCDGSVYLIADYPDLYSVIGRNFGDVGDQDYFRVPDLRRRVPAGYHPSDSNFNAMGLSGGESTHTLTIGELASHNHTQNSHNHTQNIHNHNQYSHNHTQDGHNHFQGVHNHGLDGGINAAAGSVARGMIVAGGGSNNTSSRDSTASNLPTTATNQSATATNFGETATNQATTATNQAAGSGSPHNNLQPYLVVNYLIKT